jgi:hypothetical protein
MQVERLADPWAAAHVRPAFAGDPEAAFSLCVALTNEKRGPVAVALFKARVPIAAFRTFLTSVWEHDHGGLIAAAESRRRLAAMFSYAAYPVPTGTPAVVRVWRGTAGLTMRQAARGFSWTLNRDIACWFAVRFASAGRQPLVLVAEVASADVALFHDGRNEREAVLMRPPVKTAIDGSPSDWQLGHKRYSEAIAAHTGHLIARTEMM